MTPDADSATEVREIDRFGTPDGVAGVGWIAQPEEPIQRASHAIESDGELWLIDPVETPGLDGLLDDFGPVAGVTVLLDRHTRDAAALARQHGVAVHLPEIMAGIADDLDAETVVYGQELGTTGLRPHTLVNNRYWREVALAEDPAGVLVVPESVGTTEYFTAGGERLGVNPILRVRPPTQLRRFSPDRILVGHGAGVHDRAAAALRKAIKHARRNAPGLYWKLVRHAVPV